MKGEPPQVSPPPGNTAATAANTDARSLPSAASSTRRRVSPEAQPTPSSLRAPNDAQPSNGAWANAPADLLLPIFAGVPLRPRILVLSVVCKRWRHLALRSPAWLPRLRPTATASALKILQDVRGMRDVPSKVTAPSSVCDLVLESGSAVQERGVSGLTGLTALSYDCKSVPVDVAKAMLTASKATLT